MKNRFVQLPLSVCFALCYAAMLSAGFAQGTAFTYQGRFYDGTNLANGKYDLKLNVYSLQSGGTLVAGPVTNSAVVVSNGLFTTAIDFGATVFNGQTCWLDLAARSNTTSVAFTELTPRQAINPTPYAIYAETANGAGISGTIPPSDLSGVSGAGLTGVALLGSANTFTGNETIDGMLDIDAGIGQDTNYDDVNLLGAFNDGEEHSVNFNDGSGHVASLIGGFANVTAGGYISIGNLWYQGVHPTYPGTKAFTVWSAGNVNIDPMGMNSGFLNNGNTNGSGLTFGVSSGEGIASQRLPGTNAFNQYGLDFYTDFAKRMAITQGGLVGIGLGTNRPTQALEVGNGSLQMDNGDIFLNNSASGLGSIDSPSYGLGYRSSLPGICSAGPVIFGFNGGALAGEDNSLGDNVIALSWDYNGNIWVSNNCSVGTLTIRGGADLAEPFKITKAQQPVEAGEVVVIDDANPGQLKLTDQPYDNRVAGVVSGANGINPGIQMHQQGLLEGGKNVALTGRVYVKADASNGSIKPGDFLTTSSLPGDAMKVTDHARAAGAILGKAMTSLSTGQGMVLVLVTLQ